ncbi:Membrane-bound lytic murein transglycosylase A precursor [Leclercia adecarboxylata]|uniref:Membrane-bound lytic murein transglycosylase A n=1 Tax=Leclercia adecarboxylata TaxID=83655 RepID=A0A4U9IIN9_9ENTR|nr:Membrane-bound lytic murein transglycosylase A precursor [Leclercia adecarboxylata]
MVPRMPCITPYRIGYAPGADTRTMRQYGIDAWQMEGTDNYGNVQFTGYYTPVVQARHTAQGEFKYPIYRMPPKRGRLPSRAEIYSGALSDQLHPGLQQLADG